MKRSCASQIELLLLLLHPDPGALRTFPLPLLVVDVSFDLLHRDPALSTCHVYSSIAPKSASPRSSAGLGQAALLQISNQNNPEARPLGRSARPLLLHRLPHPLRDHGRIVIDRERHGALEP